MVFNNYIFKIKEFFQNKTTLFFSLVLPLLFITFFNLTIARIDSTNNFSTIPIAVESMKIKEVLKDIEVKDGEKLFNIVESKDYSKDLESKKITAYIKGNSDLEVIVEDRTVHSSIVFETINMYNHIHKMYGKVMATDFTINPKEIMENYNRDNNIVNKLDTSNKNQSLIYFFTIIAMACLSASNQGVDIGEILNPKSEMEYVKRILISPINRFKIILAEFLGALTFSLFVTYMGLAYLAIVQPAITSFLPKIIIASTFGTILGLLFGVFISLAIKTKLTTKYNISAVLYVFSCFLAGMMVNVVPYLIDEKAPFLNYINPATVITKTLKNIYYFENNSKFLLGLSNIIILIIIFTLLILFFSRRRKNENI